MDYLLLILLCWIIFRQEQLNERTQRMPTVNELETLLAPIVTSLEEVGTQLSKAKDEIIAALGGVGQIPVGALQKIEALGAIATSLKAASQALDDLNPDTPAPTP